MEGKKIERKIVVREYNEEIDKEVVNKLERSCNVESQQGLSIYNIGDPLCRIRFYPVHTMLVAQLDENGELVGTVRGCIKRVRFYGVEGRDVKLGNILGLRVSPGHRHVGIGLKLVESIEDWMMKNGAEYMLVAIESKNITSINLFAQKYGYEKLSSLFIYIQRLVAGNSPLKDPSAQDINIHKLPVDEAVSFYKDTRLGGKGMYPIDIDAILKEKMSLGTWECYFNDKQLDEGNSVISQSSRAIFSIWHNLCEPYTYDELQVHSAIVPPPPPPARPCKCLHSALSHEKKKIFTCLNCKIPFQEGSVENVSGFLFLYGIYGEGERLGELMESVWSFASRVAENLRGCDAIITELGVEDPLKEYVPQGPSISCTEDQWYLKRVKENAGDELSMKRALGNVFIDPRDF